MRFHSDGPLLKHVFRMLSCSFVISKQQRAIDVH